MSAATWVVVGWFVLNAIFNVAWVGKARDKVTPASAVVGLFIYAGLVWAAMRSAGVW